MLSFLKNHPFAVEAHFESSIVLTFTAPKRELRHLIPECLELDIFDDNWGFVAVAMVQTKGLRPKGFPKIFGSDFFLIGYRVFVRYTNLSGKRMRGLYILKSETDSKRMEFFGNIFTHYNYGKTDVSRESGGSTITISSANSKFEIAVDMGNESPNLPLNSPFQDWKEARRFAGPLPFTFTYEPETKNVLIIEGVRQNWQPKPVNIVRYEIPFLSSLDVTGMNLAVAFMVADIPYYWKKGKREKWNG